MSRNSSGNPSSSASKKRGRNPNSNRRTASWGTNSPSTSRSSSRTAPFSDFGSYMSEKNRKLREQFDAGASSCGEGRGIFHGVSIFVDGHTIPSHQELKGFMLKHGGRFENYFSKQRVTHIICSNLPDSKLKNLRSFSRGLPVVKPTWILDSLANNKLLSWIPYQLDECVYETQRQQKLSDFFGSSKNSSFNDADNLVQTSGKSERDFTFQGATVSVDDGDFSNMESVDSGESSYAIRECSYEEKSSTSNIDGKQVYDFQGLQSSPTRSTEQFVSKSFRNQNLRDEEKDATSSDYSKKQHCTLNDPNFVKNYFKNSRLHFIGTWRSRYRKRFLDVSNEAVIGNLNVQSISTSEKSSIIHIDMDCFFVSVILRNHPELINSPVAVCHSDNPKGTAEISSANYPARQYGIRAGMFVREAKTLCSNLVIFSYDFDAYAEVADQFYTILHKHCSRVQAVSCDEAFLDVRDVHEDPQKVASMIREEIVQTTGCTASAGIAKNLLLARLATRFAKPNGQCYIPPEKIEDFLNDLQIQALPGIGYALEEKLKLRNIRTCGQLRLISKDTLQKDFGQKTGEMLWSHCRGIDNRILESVQETKSVGAEVNWGVRFMDTKDYQNFLKNLCEEVSLRLQGCGMQGRTITLKVKKRREGAGEPIKYMGCGDCINMSRSLTVPFATDNAEFLERISRQLFSSFRVDAKEVRGVGLQISKLEHTDLTKSGHSERSIQSWLSSASKNPSDQPEKVCLKGRDNDAQHINGTLAKSNPNGVGPESPSSFGQSRDIFGRSDISEIPPLSQLDMDVIRSLPSEIIAEFNNIYSGALSDFLKSSAEKSVEGAGPSKPLTLSEASGVPLCKGNEEVELKKLFVLKDYHDISDNKLALIQNKGKQPLICSDSAIEILSPKIKEGDSTRWETSKGKWSERSDLIPCSVSQVDASVLQQLPEELKADILGALPAHSREECSDVPSIHADTFPHDVVEGNYKYYNINLWEGDPPKWVHEFLASHCFILGIFADVFLLDEKSRQLSSLLQSLVSSLPTFHLSEDEWDESFSGFSEVFNQYFKSKVRTDIEEVYLCLILLKRLAQRSTFFTLVHAKLLPSVQESVNEIYGGTLKF